MEETAVTDALLRNGEGRSIGVREKLLIRPGTDSSGDFDRRGAAVEHVQEASRGWSGVDWRELWRYRELAFFLAWRDIQIRYKQTFLGASWAILQPVMTTLIFSIFFGRLAHLDQQTGRTSYFLYVLAGLLPWVFFANTLNNAAKSLVSNSQLVTKVYFPRLVIPMSTIGSGLMDFVVSLGVLLALMITQGNLPTWEVFLAPVFLLVLVLLVIGIGSYLAALTVSYRDFQYVVPFMIQLWMFITPVVYPSTIVPAWWRWLYNLNPLVGLVDGFRGAMLGIPLDLMSIGQASGISLFVFVAGVTYFRNVERRFADVV